MLTLRPTTAEDLPTVVAWEQDQDTERWLGDTGPAWHDRALRDPHQAHLLAVEAGTVVGFAVLAGLGQPADQHPGQQADEHPDQAADQSAEDGAVELRRLVLAPDRRGAGRGRALLRAVVAHAADTLGATGVWLDVKQDNDRAIALYASEGFAVTHEIGTLVFMRRAASPRDRHADRAR